MGRGCNYFRDLIGLTDYINANSGLDPLTPQQVKSVLKKANDYDDCACGGMKKNIAEQCRDCWRKSRENRMAKMATCHPERKHHAKGKCIQCYDESRKKNICKCGQPMTDGAKQCMDCYNKSRENRMAKMATCHPERKHHAKGKCPQCYSNPKKQKRRLRRFNLTLEDYEAILKAQGGMCAICDTDTPGGRGNTWCIDHDHSCCSGKGSCGKCVRGLLCSNCNFALGKFKDDVSILMVAAHYLKGGNWGDITRGDARRIA